MIKKPVKKPALNLIILGDPGAGKATQTRLLSQTYEFIDFDMGKELTRRRKHDKKLDIIHAKTTDKGKLTPTNIVRNIILEKLSSTPRDKGIVFDGFPKMLGEAKLISRLINKLGREKPIVIYLAIPNEEIKKRVLNRTGYYRKKFGKRPDDSVKALQNRAMYYAKNISAVVKYFKQQYPYTKLDASGSIPTVHRKIISTIKKNVPK